MKKLILFFSTLLLAAGIGVLIHNHPAYVYVRIGHINIQASLWFSAIAFMVTIYCVYLLLNLVRSIYYLPSNLQNFTIKRREKKSHLLTQKALIALLESRWKDAELYFYKSAKKQATPFFHYLAAAQSAFEQKKTDASLRYLKKAQSVAKPSEVLAVEITRARWQLLTQEFQPALSTLLLLQKMVANHPFVLNGLKEVYVATQNWQNLYELLPQLRNHTTLDHALLDNLEQSALHVLLEKASQLQSPTALEESWNTISKKWHENPDLLAIYAKYLIERNQHEKAEKILKAALKKNLDGALLQQYARINSTDPVKQLARAELWLKRDVKNSDLLLCLGYICAQHRLWGKAKTYLELSLKYRTRTDVYPILGEVLEHLDQKHAALDCYKKGLTLLTQPLPS